MGVSGRAILILLIISFFARLPFLFGNTVAWDAAVYIGMGKHIFSAGQSGLWEASRPVLWPLFLGAFWKTGIDMVLFGKIAATLFSIGTVYLTCLIGERLFSRKIGIVAAAMVSFSPTFFNNNPVLLTGIPASFFSLLAVYFFIENKNALSGFFFGLAFLARFFEALIPASLLLLLCFNRGYGGHTSFFRKLSIATAFFAIAVSPYLFANKLLYGDALLPFSLQIFLTQNTGWPWFEPVGYYFASMIKENIISLFALAGIFLIFFRKGDNKDSKLKDVRQIPAIILLSVFIALSIPSHKEMRFLIPLLPYIYLLAAYGLFCLLSRLESKTMAAVIITALFSAAAFQAFSSLREQAFYNDAGLQEYAQHTYGKIWVSSPIYIVKTDKGVSELIYYPSFEKRSEELLSKLSSRESMPEFVLLNSCDISCNPKDASCPLEKEKFIGELKKALKADYYRKAGSCEKYVFVSQPVSAS